MLEKNLEKQQDRKTAQQSDMLPQQDIQLELQQSEQSAAEAAQQHEDMSLSKVQPSPAPPTPATLSLQEELSEQQQLTDELRQTVAKLTAQLAQSSPGTPPHEGWQHIALTPVTYPTENIAASQPPSSPDSTSSGAEDTGTEAEPMQLLGKFQQADTATDASQMQSPAGKQEIGVKSVVTATPQRHSDALTKGDQAAPSHAEALANGMLASRESSPVQLSLPNTATSSPSVAGTPGPNMQIQGSGFKSVTHVNDSFNASDEDVGSDPASPPRETLPIERPTRQQEVRSFGQHSMVQHEA